MKTVEITYRYDGAAAASRPRPLDADAAKARLDEGSRTIGALFENVSRARESRSA